MRNRLPATTLLLMLLATVARAQVPKALPMWPIQEHEALVKGTNPTREPPPETSRLVAALTSVDFATREAASRELAAKGVDAFPGLREVVLASDDPELRARTVGRFGPGKFIVSTRLPASIAAMAEAYDKSRERYGQQGTGLPPFSGVSDEDVVLFLTTALQIETDDKIRAALQHELDARRAISARLLIARGDLGGAQRLLESEPLRDDLDCAVLLALRQGDALDPAKEVESLGLKGADAIRMQTFLYRAKGDLQQAAQIAQPELRAEWFPWEEILIETGDYSKLITVIDSNPRERLSSIRPIIACQLLGENQRADAILRDMVTRTHNVDARQLFRLDRINEAEAARADPGDLLHDLGELLHGEFAFQVFFARLQIREALATVNDRPMQCAEQLASQGLTSAARALLAKVRPQDPEIDGSQHYSYSQYADDLAMVGLLKESNECREAGLKLLEPIADRCTEMQLQLAKLEQKLNGIERSRQPREWDDAHVEYLKLSVQVHNVRETVTRMHFVGNPELPGVDDVRDADLLFNEILPDQVTSVRARYGLTLRIIHGEALSEQDKNTLMTALVAAVRPMFFEGDLRHLLEPLQRRFHKTHHDDWTEELVDRLVVAYRDPEAWSLMGDQAMDAGQPAQAADYYRRAAVLRLTDASLMYRLGLALQRVPATATQGKQMLDYAPLLVLADYAHAWRVAEEMNRFEGAGKGDAWFESYTRRYSYITEYDYGTSVKIARDAAEAAGDYAKAYDLQKKLLFSPPYPVHVYPLMPSDAVVLLSNTAHFHRLRALDALIRKDMSTLVDALNREMDDGPPDVELLEKMIPALKAVDAAGAQKIVGRAMERLKPVVEDYPDATRYKDQLTRVMALAK